MQNKKKENEHDSWLRSENDFSELDEIISEMIEKMMENQDLTENQLVVMGFAFRMGEDGKPIVQEFPQSDPSKESVQEIEPIVETQNLEKTFLVTVSLPGIKKEELDLHTEKQAVTVTAWNSEQYFVKHIRLPQEIEPRKTKASFKNTILEIDLPKKTAVPLKNKIKID